MIFVRYSMKRVKRSFDPDIMKCQKGDKPMREYIVETKNLKKSQIKGCMSGSKVKKVYVKVGTKAQNKKVLKSYKKFFRKSVIGRKVKIV